MKKGYIMKKRILCVLLAFVLILGMAPVALATTAAVDTVAAEAETLSSNNVRFEFESVPLDGHQFNNSPFMHGARIRVFRDGTLAHEGFTVQGTGRHNLETTIGTTEEFRLEITFPSGWVFHGFRGADIIREVPGNPYVRVVRSEDIIGSRFFNSAFNQYELNVGWGAIPGTSTPRPPEHHRQFTDVRLNAWYHDAVDFVFANGIMTGTSATTFAPGNNFNREMLVATLFRMYHGRNANSSDSRTNQFADVASNSWFAPYVTWASANGIVQGTSSTTFGAGNAISRQDFAVLMYRFANFADVSTEVPTSFTLDFPDVNRVGSWAQDALAWAVYSGLITGTGGQLVPMGIASRAQAATILMRYIQDVQ